MENVFNEQPAAALETPSGEAAPGAQQPDSVQVQEGAIEGQPSGRKWAKIFDSPEKLENAYGHIFKAYHAKCREMQQTSQVIDGMVRMLGQGGGLEGLPGSAQPGGGQPAGNLDALLQAALGEALGATQPGRAGQLHQAARADSQAALMHAVRQAHAEAQQARTMGQKFLVASLESQAREFFKDHPEIGGGEPDFDRFAVEVSRWLGPVDADAFNKMPEALEKAYRVVNYPEALRAAARQRAEDEQEAERFVVEGGGSGSMSVPKNAARETSFRALVQRLKREAGLA